MDITTILFLVFAGILLAAALGVITARNPVHAVLLLVLAFFSAACLWMLLRAEFLAIALVLVYVGAVMVLFLAIVLGGCAYQADSFSYSREPFRGAYATVDCVDLAIEHREDRQHGDVVAYAFGNRCDEPVVVDLASARVYGHTADGAAIQLLAFDPAGEIRPMRIDGRAVGREAIEYPNDGALLDICVDAVSIARASPPRWLCFQNSD